MINLNGTEYYTKDELEAEGYADSAHVIVIADRGWIFEGRVTDPERPYALTDAHVVRSWANGLGIGGLQSAEHRDEYTLDDLPSGIEVAARAVIAVLPVTEW